MWNCNDLEVGDIIWLRFLHFADDNTLDFRLNGRPYLIHQLDENFAYLFKMSTNTTFNEDEKNMYYKLNESKYFKESYIDLRYLIKISKEDLLKKYVNENMIKPKRKLRRKIGFLDDNLLEEITQKIQSLDNIPIVTQNFQEETNDKYDCIEKESFYQIDNEYVDTCDCIDERLDNVVENIHAESEAVLDEIEEKIKKNKKIS